MTALTNAKKYAKIKGMKVLYESGENYLEAVMMLKKEKSTVLSVDVANHMRFSKASVSRGMKILKEEGYITVSKGGAIDFTLKGASAAAAIYERHRIITRFLADKLDINEKTAEQDACRIEHVISEETFTAIKSALK